MNQPIWQPSADRVSGANLNRFLRFVDTQAGPPHALDCSALHNFSIHQAERFWPLVWEFCGIRASGNWDAVLVGHEAMHQAQWFPEVTLNHAQNLLRHRDDRLAIIERRDDGSERTYSYRELNDAVASMASALAARGLNAGQRVAGVLPASAERIIAALAVTSMGGIWASLAPATERALLLDRLRAIEPALVITGGAAATADMVHELGALLGDSAQIVVVDGPCPLGTQSWAELAATEPAPLRFAALPFDHPLYITWNGAGARPLVQTAGGTLIQHLKELVLHTDLKREDRIWCESGDDCAVFNWVTSGLAVGATIVLSEQQDEDGTAAWALVDELSITVLGRRGSWIDAQRRSGATPRDSHRLASLKTLLVPDGPLADENWEFVYDRVKDRLLLSPMVGLADIGSCLALGNPLVPAHAGTVQSRGLGMRVEVLDDNHQAVREQAGKLACLAPFPGLPGGFWNDADDAQYRQQFFAAVPGAYSNGLSAVLTRGDSLIITGS